MLLLNSVNINHLAIDIVVHLVPELIDSFFDLKHDEGETFELRVFVIKVLNDSPNPAKNYLVTNVDMLLINN